MLIKLTNVTYSRSNKKKCADKLCFSLSKGERIAITGENGTGKSTLLQIMLGLLNDTKGEIVLFGQRCLSERDFKKVRTRIGYLFQDSDDQLFCPTVIEDVCFGPLNQGCSAKQALDIAHQTLSDLKIEHLAEQVSHRLSGGEKKLVSLATILAMKPKVLLLDEPTNGLDEKNYRQFINIIQSTGLPIVLISHDKNLRRVLTDKEYLLSNGKLSLKNPASTLN